MSRYNKNKVLEVFCQLCNNIYFIPRTVVMVKLSPPLPKKIIAYVKL